MIRVFLADLTYIFEEENYHKAFFASSPQRQKKAEKYRNLPDQARCIGAGLLLEQSVWLFQNREMQTEDVPNPIYVDLQTFLETVSDTERFSAKQKNAYLSLQYEKSGRPFLEGEGHGGIPYLSISHSASYAAVAVSDQPVGIDIEHTRKISASVAKKILTPDEYLRYTQLQDKAEDQGEYLLEKWTQKEAIAKLDGSGVFTLLPYLSDSSYMQTKGIGIRCFKQPAPGYFLSIAYKKGFT